MMFTKMDARFDSMRLEALALKDSLLGAAIFIIDSILYKSSYILLSSSSIPRLSFRELECETDLVLDIFV